MFHYGRGHRCNQSACQATKQPNPSIHLPYQPRLYPPPHSNQTGRKTRGDLCGARLKAQSGHVFERPQRPRVPTRPTSVQRCHHHRHGPWIWPFYEFHGRDVSNGWGMRWPSFLCVMHSGHLPLTFVASIFVCAGVSSMISSSSRAPTPGPGRLAAKCRLSRTTIWCPTRPPAKAITRT